MLSSSQVNLHLDDLSLRLFRCCLPLLHRDLVRAPGTNFARLGPLVEQE